jgi:hypothetical protein
LTAAEVLVVFSRGKWQSHSKISRKSANNLFQKIWGMQVGLIENELGGN